jgi:prepilin-type N-terminal cleavage/methylation domain-containing protein
MCRNTVTEARKGFTLVELAVVIVIIGVLAAFGVPRFLKSVERSKAAEAFQYLAAVRAAQERFISKEGKYCTNAQFTATPSGLDITQAAPKYFDIKAMEVVTTAGNPGWSLQLQRKQGSSSYGTYTVTFNQDGFDPTPANSSIVSKDGINPMGN